MRTTDFRGGSTARAFKNGTLAAITVGAACVFATGEASAGCGDAWTPPSGSAPPLRDAPPAAAFPGMVPAVYAAATARSCRSSTITATANPASSAPGAESGSRRSDGRLRHLPVAQRQHGDSHLGRAAPSSGDVCMGVWKQIGPRTYTMKHIGLSWLSADTVPSATPAT